MKRIVTIAGLVMLLATLWGGAAAAQEDECFQVGGQWDSERGQCILANTLRSQPLSAGATDHERSRRRWTLTWTGRAAFYSRCDYALSRRPARLLLDIDYELIQFSPSVASIQFRAYEYTGGGHGMNLPDAHLDLDASAN